MPAAKKSSTTRTTAANNSGKRKTVQPANSANQISRVSDGVVKKHRAESTPSGMPFSADWREPKEYPPPDCIDMAWLAWEFLRRNNNYAQHVQQMLALPSIEFEKGLTARGNASLDGMVCTPPAKPGENVKQFRRRVATETSGKTKVKKKKEKDAASIEAR